MIKYRDINILKLSLLFFILDSQLIAEEAGMPQFNAESFYSQLFWLTISFTTLYLIITYILLPRVRENIRLRKNKISNDLERAESIKIEIEKMISQSNSKIEDAKNQVKHMIKKSINRSLTEYDSQITNIKKQISNKQLEVEKNLDNYKNNIEKEMLDSAISLSAIILNKLKYKSLSSDELLEAIKKSKIENNV